MKYINKIIAVMVIVLIILLSLFNIYLTQNISLDTNKHSESISSLSKRISEIEKLIKELPTPQDGKTPVKGLDYFDGIDGEYGKSIKGKDGEDSNSTNTVQEKTTIKEVPVNGLSAYELALQAGFSGSLNEWLESLKGKTPILICNNVKDRWELIYIGETNRGVVKDLDNNPVKCKV